LAPLLRGADSAARCPYQFPDAVNFGFRVDRSPVIGSFNSAAKAFVAMVEHSNEVANSRLIFMVNNFKTP
jgi:hypothetical protein